MTRVAMNTGAPELRRRKQSPPGTVVRALVVDDDPGYAAYVTVLLRRAGIVVDCAGDGIQALERIRSGPAYDLLLVDHDMPRLNGIQLIRILRTEKATQSTYAVMLTARAEIDVKISALTEGFDDFLFKAATESELIAKIAASRRLVARQQTVDSALRQFQNYATTDELTGLRNRRFFLEEARHALSGTAEVSMALFDLDHFKSINDTHGHLVGDRVLRDVAAVLTRNTRYEDCVARYGGDEFVMLTHDLSLEELEEIVNRISSRVDQLQWDGAGSQFGVGISGGLASTRLMDGRAIDALFAIADQDLYKTKFLKKTSDESANYSYGRDRSAEVLEFHRETEHSIAPSEKRSGAGGAHPDAKK